MRVLLECVPVAVKTTGTILLSMRKSTCMSEQNFAVLYFISGHFHTPFAKILVNFKQLVRPFAKCIIVISIYKNLRHFIFGNIFYVTF